MPVPETNTSIRDVRPNDADAIADIYNCYVQTSIATFEEQPVTPNEILSRIESVGSASLPWLVAAQADQVIGYAYASPWRPRSAYRFSAETSAYVDRKHLGIGVGSALYSPLLAALRKRGVHAVMGGISLPNDASVALHEKFGFHKVAHFSDVGFKFGDWIDVGYWQRVF